jgi:hypothetical protein
LIQICDLEDFLLVVRQVAEGHTPVANPDPLPQLHEEPQGSRAVVVRFAEVQDDILDSGAIQKVKNLRRSRLDTLVLLFSQV